MKIDNVSKSDHQTLLTIWEASVRATHDFITEQYINEIKPLILAQYFDAVDLRCVKDNNGTILGFCGVAEQNIEMLFVAPQHAGKGVGTQLTCYAIEKLAAYKVDVNEQNPQALGFYQQLGFVVVSRSETDDQGKPYPLLHMKLR
ncbi:MAG: GNAT family N-acetyltransferase [Psychrosphaera sp.]|nr:GNAT family N-acetyltransferase [Psychrosphaera sp.]